MGIIRRAVIGSLIAGAGVIAIVKNKKTVAKIGKDVTKSVKKVLHNADRKISTRRRKVL